ncbi:MULTISPECIES: GNAT family N-acetyltransferase [unclassified Janthinobacterium]|uniref:GNAT family N-acetyltransferase n=1 Tax=unclassified Janthinobacterium TaxID=2610881 RepID=UPI00034CF966|nr:MULTISPECIES: GNAT family N-acetyltransferase [unclassified Janthinobacterium]MEC5161446.1 putative acetyltransferase [Janthinobacterium sp. CG_S6]
MTAARRGALAFRVGGAADIAALWALRSAALRRGCASHYPPRVVELWSACAPPDGYAGLLDGGGAVLAESEQGLLGYAVLDRASGEVCAVFVDPDCGGRGVGKALLQALCELACADGIARLYLYASLNAVDFYRAAGFTAIRDEQYAHPCGVALSCVYMEMALLMPFS